MSSSPPISAADTQASEANASSPSLAALLARVLANSIAHADGTVPVSAANGMGSALMFKHQDANGTLAHDEDAVLAAARESQRALLSCLLRVSTTSPAQGLVAVDKSTAGTCDDVAQEAQQAPTQKDTTELPSVGKGMPLCAQAPSQEYRYLFPLKPELEEDFRTLPELDELVDLAQPTVRQRPVRDLDAQGQCSHHMDAAGIALFPPSASADAPTTTAPQNAPNSAESGLSIPPPLASSSTPPEQRQQRQQQKQQQQSQPSHASGATEQDTLSLRSNPRKSSRSSSQKSTDATKHAAQPSSSSPTTEPSPALTTPPPSRTASSSAATAAAVTTSGNHTSTPTKTEELYYHYTHQQMGARASTTAPPPNVLLAAAKRQQTQWREQEQQRRRADTSGEGSPREGSRASQPALGPPPRGLLMPPEPSVLSGVSPTASSKDMSLVSQGQAMAHPAEASLRSTQDRQTRLSNNRGDGNVLSGEEQSDGNGTDGDTFAQQRKRRLQKLHELNVKRLYPHLVAITPTVTALPTQRATVASVEGQTVVQPSAATPNVSMNTSTNPDGSVDAGDFHDREHLKNETHGPFGSHTRVAGPSSSGEALPCPPSILQPLTELEKNHALRAWPAVVDRYAHIRTCLQDAWRLWQAQVAHSAREKDASRKSENPEAHPTTTTEVSPLDGPPASHIETEAEKPRQTPSEVERLLAAIRASLYRSAHELQATGAEHESSSAPLSEADGTILLPSLLRMCLATEDGNDVVEDTLGAFTQWLLEDHASGDVPHPSAASAPAADTSPVLSRVHVLNTNTATAQPPTSDAEEGAPHRGAATHSPADKDDDSDDEGGTTNKLHRSAHARENLRKLENLLLYAGSGLPAGQSAANANVWGKPLVVGVLRRFPREAVPFRIRLLPAHEICPRGETASPVHADVLQAAATAAAAASQQQPQTTHTVGINDSMPSVEVAPYHVILIEVTGWERSEENGEEPLHSNQDENPHARGRRRRSSSRQIPANESNAPISQGEDDKNGHKTEEGEQDGRAASTSSSPPPEVSHTRNKRREHARRSSSSSTATVLSETHVALWQRLVSLSHFIHVAGTQEEVQHAARYVAAAIKRKRQRTSLVAGNPLAALETASLCDMMAQKSLYTFFCTLVSRQEGHDMDRGKGTAGKRRRGASGTTEAARDRPANRQEVNRGKARNVSTAPSHEGQGVPTPVRASSSPPTSSTTRKDSQLPSSPTAHAAGAAPPPRAASSPVKSFFSLPGLGLRSLIRAARGSAPPPPEPENSTPTDPADVTATSREGTEDVLDTTRMKSPPPTRAEAVADWLYRRVIPVFLDKEAPAPLASEEPHAPARSVLISRVQHISAEMFVTNMGGTVAAPSPSPFSPKERTSPVYWSSSIDLPVTLTIPWQEEELVTYLLTHQIFFRDDLPESDAPSTVSVCSTDDDDEDNDVHPPASTTWERQEDRRAPRGDRPLALAAPPPARSHSYPRTSVGRERAQSVPRTPQNSPLARKVSFLDTSDTVPESPPPKPPHHASSSPSTAAAVLVAKANVPKDKRTPRSILKSGSRYKRAKLIHDSAPATSLIPCPSLMQWRWCVAEDRERQATATEVATGSLHDSRMHLQTPLLLLDTTGAPADAFAVTAETYLRNVRHVAVLLGCEVASLGVLGIVSAETRNSERLSLTPFSPSSSDVAADATKPTPSGPTTDGGPAQTRQGDDVVANVFHVIQRHFHRQFHQQQRQQESTTKTTAATSAPSADRPPWETGQKEDLTAWVEGVLHRSLGVGHADVRRWVSAMSTASIHAALAPFAPFLAPPVSTQQRAARGDEKHRKEEEEEAGELGGLHQHTWPTGVPFPCLPSVTQHRLQVLRDACLVEMQMELHAALFPFLDRTLRRLSLALAEEKLRVLCQPLATFFDGEVYQRATAAAMAGNEGKGRAEEPAAQEGTRGKKAPRTTAAGAAHLLDTLKAQRKLVELCNYLSYHYKTCLLLPHIVFEEATTALGIAGVHGDADGAARARERKGQVGSSVFHVGVAHVDDVLFASGHPIPQQASGSFLASSAPAAATTDMSPDRTSTVGTGFRPLGYAQPSFRVATRLPCESSGGTSEYSPLMPVAASYTPQFRRHTLDEAFDSFRTYREPPQQGHPSVVELVPVGGESGATTARMGERPTRDRLEGSSSEQSNMPTGFKPLDDVNSTHGTHPEAAHQRRFTELIGALTVNFEDASKGDVDPAQDCPSVVESLTALSALKSTTDSAHLAPMPHGATAPAALRGNRAPVFDPDALARAGAAFREGGPLFCPSSTDDGVDGSDEEEEEEHRPGTASSTLDRSKNSTYNNTQRPRGSGPSQTPILTPDIATEDTSTRAGEATERAMRPVSAPASPSLSPRHHRGHPQLHRQSSHPSHFGTSRNFFRLPVTLFIPPTLNAATPPSLAPTPDRHAHGSSTSGPTAAAAAAAPTGIEDIPGSPNPHTPAESTSAAVSMPTVAFDHAFTIMTFTRCASTRTVTGMRNGGGGGGVARAAGRAFSESLSTSNNVRGMTPSSGTQHHNTVSWGAGAGNEGEEKLTPLSLSLAPTPQHATEKAPTAAHAHREPAATAAPPLSVPPLQDVRESALIDRWASEAKDALFAQIFTTWILPHWLAITPPCTADAEAALDRAGAAAAGEEERATETACEGARVAGTPPSLAPREEGNPAQADTTPPEKNWEAARQPPRMQDKNTQTHKPRDDAILGRTSDQTDDGNAREALAALRQAVEEARDQLLDLLQLCDDMKQNAPENIAIVPASSPATEEDKGQDHGGKAPASLVRGGDGHAEIVFSEETAAESPQSDPPSRRPRRVSFSEPVVVLPDRDNEEGDMPKDKTQPHPKAEETLALAQQILEELSLALGTAPGDWRASLRAKRRRSPQEEEGGQPPTSRRHTASMPDFTVLGNSGGGCGDGGGEVRDGGAKGHARGVGCLHTGTSPLGNEEGEEADLSQAFQGSQCPTPPSDDSTYHRPRRSGGDATDSDGFGAGAASLSRGASELYAPLNPAAYSQTAMGNYTFASIPNAPQGSSLLATPSPTARHHGEGNSTSQTHTSSGIRGVRQGRPPQGSPSLEDARASPVRMQYGALAAPFGHRPHVRVAEDPIATSPLFAAGTLSAGVRPNGSEGSGGGSSSDNAMNECSHPGLLSLVSVGGARGASPSPGGNEKDSSRRASPTPPAYPLEPVMVTTKPELVDAQTQTSLPCEGLPVSPLPPGVGTADVTLSPSSVSTASTPHRAGGGTSGPHANADKSLLEEAITHFGSRAADNRGGAPQDDEHAQLMDSTTSGGRAPTASHTTATRTASAHDTHDGDNNEHGESPCRTDEGILVTSQDTFLQSGYGVHVDPTSSLHGPNASALHASLDSDDGHPMAAPPRELLASRVTPLHDALLQSSFPHHSNNTAIHEIEGKEIPKLSSFKSSPAASPPHSNTARDRTRTFAGDPPAASTTSASTSGQGSSAPAVILVPSTTHAAAPTDVPSVRRPPADAPQRETFLGTPDTHSPGPTPTARWHTNRGIAADLEGEADTPRYLGALHTPDKSQAAVTALADLQNRLSHSGQKASWLLSQLKDTEERLAEREETLEALQRQLWEREADLFQLQQQLQQQQQQQLLQQQQQEQQQQKSRQEEREPGVSVAVDARVTLCDKGVETDADLPPPLAAPVHVKAAPATSSVPDAELLQQRVSELEKALANARFRMAEWQKLVEAERGKHAVELHQLQQQLQQASRVSRSPSNASDLSQQQQQQGRRSPSPEQRALHQLLEERVAQLEEACRTAEQERDAAKQEVRTTKSNAASEKIQQDATARQLRDRLTDAVQEGSDAKDALAHTAEEARALQRERDRLARDLQDAAARLRRQEDTHKAETLELVRERDAAVRAQADALEDAKRESQRALREAAAQHTDAVAAKDDAIRMLQSELEQEKDKGKHLEAALATATATEAPKPRPTDSSRSEREVQVNHDTITADALHQLSEQLAEVRKDAAAEKRRADVLAEALAAREGTVKALQDALNDAQIAREAERAKAEDILAQHRRSEQTKLQTQAHIAAEAQQAALRQLAQELSQAHAAELDQMRADSAQQLAQAKSEAEADMRQLVKQETARAQDRAAAKEAHAEASRSAVIEAHNFRIVRYLYHWRLAWEGCIEQKLSCYGESILLACLAAPEPTRARKPAVTVAVAATTSAAGGNGVSRQGNGLTSDSSTGSHLSPAPQAPGDDGTTRQRSKARSSRRPIADSSSSSSSSSAHSGAHNGAEEDEDPLALQYELSQKRRQIAALQEQVKQLEASRRQDGQTLRMYKEMLHVQQELGQESQASLSPAGGGGAKGGRNAVLPASDLHTPVRQTPSAATGGPASPETYRQKYAALQAGRRK